MATTPHRQSAHADLDNKISQSSLQRLHDSTTRGAKNLKIRNDGAARKSSSVAIHASDEVSGVEQSDDDEDEGDSNAGDENAEDEDDEPNSFAPSHGIGMIENNHPSNLILGKVKLSKNLHGRGAGLSNGNSLAPPFTPSKKRTLSSMSNTSVLDRSSDDQAGTPLGFPRKKKHRTLSNDGSGLLTYSAIRRSTDISGIPEIAVESDDDDDDDDAIYRAVDLISDDEEDEPDVEKVEEEVIMSTEICFGRDSYFSGLSSDMFDDIPGNIFGTPDRSLGQLSDFPFGDSDRQPAAGQGVDGRKYSTGSTKRVRFWDEQSADEDSSSTSSDLDAMFPDIFAEQDNLPPMLQKLIENDTDGDIGNLSGSDGEHSYWDFSETDQTSPSRGFMDEDIDDIGDSSSSSGYDSDEGETTDEECPPPTTIRSAKTLLHRSSSSDTDTAAHPRRSFQRSKTKSARNAGPRWGHFSVDPRKATAFTDRTGRRVIVHPPQIPNAHSKFFPGSSAESTANNSPRTSLLATPGDESDLGELTPQNVTNPRDIMFGGIFGMPQDVGNLLKGHVIGPPEAFFPFVALDSNGNPIEEDDEYSEDEDDIDDDLDLESFLALPEGVEDSILETPSRHNADSDFAGLSDCPESTPVARTRSVGESMLEHFDRTPGVVSSFRSNQDKYRNIASQHPNPDLRASNSRAVRFGKSAETPITPIRKRGVHSRKVSHIESPLLRHSARRTGPRMGTFT